MESSSVWLSLKKGLINLATEPWTLENFIWNLEN